MTPARNPRPCRLRVYLPVTEEYGYACIQWADGSYSVKLDNGAWAHDVPAATLSFLRSEAQVAA